LGINTSTHRVERRPLDTGRIEVLADLAGIPLAPTMGAPWMGLAPDDSALVMRDRSTCEFYALDWETP
jgi:hypothetical protein